MVVAQGPSIVQVYWSDFDMRLQDYQSKRCTNSLTDVSVTLQCYRQNVIFMIPSDHVE